GAGAGGAGANPFGSGDAPAAPQDLTGGEAPAARGESFTPGQGGNPGGMGQVDTQLVQWLIANRGDATYLVAVSSAGQAESIILQTGLPVMATGGFSGSDPILTADSLAQLVASGAVRYFLLGGGMGGGMDGGNSSTGLRVATWVA